MGQVIKHYWGHVFQHQRILTTKMAAVLTFLAWARLHSMSRDGKLKDVTYAQTLMTSCHIRSQPVLVRYYCQAYHVEHNQMKFLS